MNPPSNSQPIPPPLPPLPHLPSTSCLLHPQEIFTGFCPLCLYERLSLLDPSSSSSSSSSKKPPSSAASAIKSLFKPNNSSLRTKPTSFFPELRRSKSFSASKNEGLGFSGFFEPQRKSCDVRVQNTLLSLFTQNLEAAAAASSSSSTNLKAPVFEEKEEEEEGKFGVSVEEEEEEEEEPHLGNVLENRVEEERQEIEEELESKSKSKSESVEEEEPEEDKEGEEIKTMKDHIDLDSQTKKHSGKDLKGSFWSAASVFSKKLQKWREKQKAKKNRNGGGSTALPVEKPIGRHFRETQSEIADYGFGRRSCDTDPRFSLDAGRMSFDDPRYSFDEPRASWDGYLISRTFPRMPTMLSVVEDAPVNVYRTDTQIPVEEPRISMKDDDVLPGGSSQTRDYYSDSSSRRRKSLDRSNSIRKTAAAVVAEIDEMQSVSNSKVSPTTTDVCHGPKVAMLDRDSNSNSLRDDGSMTFDTTTTFNDSSSVIGTGNVKETKKSRRWGKGWNIWGLINRKSGNKDEDEDRLSRPNGVERSYSESWPELRGDRNIDGKGGFNPKMFRSNSSVSWRNSNMISGSRKSNAEANDGHGIGRKKKEEIVLERNRSARHSPTNVDNGLLRFYWTPMRGSRRGGSGTGKVKQNQAQSIARSVLRLY